MDDAAAAGAAAAVAAGAPLLGNPILEPDPLLQRARHRIYSLLLLRAAMAYFMTVPQIFRRVLEYAVLAGAILSFALLVHLHVIFIRSPLTCLDSVKNTWPRHGILRVQIGSYGPEDGVFGAAHYGSGFSGIPGEERLYANLTAIEAKMAAMARPLTLHQYRVDTASRVLMRDDDDRTAAAADDQEDRSTIPSLYFSQLLHTLASDADHSSLLVRSSHESLSFTSGLDDDELEPALAYYARKNAAFPQPYMVEYSLEYGLLRLSEEMRAHYKVPVLTVTLCPQKDACFGDPLARFMLRNFLGYDDVLIGSIKQLAEHENNRGYVRNVATGEHFRFVNVWMTRASYLAAGFIMIVFTLFVSMLIRYSHQQVFVFVSEFLRTIEQQQPLSRITLVAASLITVILALIGMEAIMYEFFSDSSVAFHVIIMVWAADQFESMAIRSPVSKRHFLRFFYLYQFAFYAYHYRFNGQYAGLALLTTMLFTYHAMIFFFHHYELPLVQEMENRMRMGDQGPPPAHQAHARPTTENNNNNNNNDESTNQNAGTTTSSSNQTTTSPSTANQSTNTAAPNNDHSTNASSFITTATGSAIIPPITRILRLTAANLPHIITPIIAVRTDAQGNSQIVASATTTTTTTASSQTEATNNNGQNSSASDNITTGSSHQSINSLIDLEID